MTNGQTVRVRHTTSASYGATTYTTLTIGGVSDVFTSITVVALPAGYIKQGGLTWSPNNTTVPAPGHADWNTANNYCNTATINGETGWRLPTLDELLSLFASGALDGKGWSLFISWSSRPNTANSHFGVHLESGDIGVGNDGNSTDVTCVR